MTAEEYRKNELFRPALAQTLQEPHVQRAIDVLKELGEPLEMPTPSGLNFMEWNAMQNARREGYFHALRSLERLAMPARLAPSARDLMPSLVEE
jgi:hypothetical protein